MPRKKKDMFGGSSTDDLAALGGKLADLLDRKAFLKMLAKSGLPVSDARELARLFEATQA